MLPRPYGARMFFCRPLTINAHSLWAGLLTGPLGPTAGFLQFLETCGRAGFAVVKPRHNSAVVHA